MVEEPVGDLLPGMVSEPLLAHRSFPHSRPEVRLPQGQSVRGFPRLQHEHSSLLHERSSLLHRERSSNPHHERSSNLPGQNSITRHAAERLVGHNGALVKVAEYIPFVNNGIQVAHKKLGHQDALERARRHNPIGADGIITRVGENIPVLNDGIMAVHIATGKADQAERVRARTVQGLLSKDGAGTRLVEAVPGLNLVAAAMHEINGNSEEAHRAMHLLDNWGHLGDKDGALAKLAELVPGTDLVAFVAHIERGDYAQALRAIVKMSWMEVKVNRLIVEAIVASEPELCLQTLDLEGVFINPKSASMMGALVDVAVHALGMSRSQEGLRDNVGDLIIKAANGAMTDLRNKQLYLLETAIHNGVRQGNREVLKLYNQHQHAEWYEPKSFLMKRLLQSLPEEIPVPSFALLKAVNRAILTTSIRHEAIPEVHFVRPQAHARSVVRPAQAVTCLSVLCCLACPSSACLPACGLGCLAGAVSGATMAGRAALSLLRDFTRKSRQHFCGRGPPLLEPYKTATGIVVEIDQDSLAELSGGIWRYVCHEYLKDRGFWRRLLVTAGQLLKHLGKHQGGERLHGLPLAVDIVVPAGPVCSRKDGGPLDLTLPELRLLLILDISFNANGPVVVRGQVAVKDELVDEILTSVVKQLAEQDLRTLDASLKGFPEPFKLDLKARLDWPQPSKARLQVQDVYVKLFLPD